MQDPWKCITIVEIVREQFEDTKGSLEAICRGSTDQIIGKEENNTNRQTIIHNTLHKKRKIERHESYYKSEVKHMSSERISSSLCHFQSTSHICNMKTPLHFQFYFSQNLFLLHQVSEAQADD